MTRRWDIQRARKAQEERNERFTGVLEILRELDRPVREARVNVDDAAMLHVMDALGELWRGDLPFHAVER